MSEITAVLRKVYDAEVADIRRVLHYEKPELDVEEIIKRDVLLGYVSDHLERVTIITQLFDLGKLETGEDYFYASFILVQELEDNLGNFTLGCMLAKVARRLNFFGNTAVPDVDAYIQKVENIFYTRITGLK